MVFTGGAPLPSTIYVSNLPPGTDETLLAEHFGTIGVLKKDKRTGRVKIWIYRDKVTNEPKGDATVAYEDPYAAVAAVEWFDNKDFHGSIINVCIAETKSKEAVEPTHVRTVPGQLGSDVNALITDDLSLGAIADGNIDDSWGGPGGGRGRGRGELAVKAWQQEGDWLCPNPSCSNVNFAFRGVCNRCGTARPAGSLNAGGRGLGGGRGRARRGGAEGSEHGRGPGGPPGLFGPNDWTCPMCGNINWAKRNKCNICNTTKPGLSEGGVREGRAGGYKEFDEAEIEETKRRRREAEEDDGEMYDEFGNLKKKFRAKAKQEESGSSHQITTGTGKAGWGMEELGVVERDKAREKGKDRNNGFDYERSGDGHNGFRSLRDDEYDSHDNNEGYDRSRERNHDRHGRDRERSYRDRDIDRHREKEKSRERDREWEKDKGRAKDRDRERDRDRGRDRGWSRERERGRERFLD